MKHMQRFSPLKKSVDNHFSMLNVLKRVVSLFPIDSSDDSTPVNRDGAKNKPPSGSDHQVLSRQNDLASRSLGSAMFPDEDTEEGIFHMEVLLSVQRWFSAQGWPGGPYPISIPHSLRV